MIKNIIFDYGNTIVEFKPREIIKGFGVTNITDIDLLENVFFDRKYWDRFDDGSLSTEDFKKIMEEVLPTHLIGISNEMADNWLQRLPYIKGMDELIIKLKNNGYKLYLLSNISKEFAQQKDEVEIFKYFDGLVFSGAIGIVKPNVEIFEYILNKYELVPEECLFVDDNKSNIQAAENIGINTLLFTGDYKDIEGIICRHDNRNRQG